MTTVAARVAERFLSGETDEVMLVHSEFVSTLTQRPRFADHSRETFDSVLDTCERIARDKFAPFNRLVDTEEPRIDDDGRVVLPQATHDAWHAYAGSGMLAAAQSEDWGGMNLPYVVEAAHSFEVVELDGRRAARVRVTRVALPTEGDEGPQEA